MGFEEPWRELGRMGFEEPWRELGRMALGSLGERPNGLDLLWCLDGWVWEVALEVALKP